MTKNEALDIMQDAGFGFLATIDGDQPCVRPMMPYLAEENELLLALLGRSRTIEHVRISPKVEFCFVDRKMSYCRIKGVGTITTDVEKKMTVFNAIPMLRQYFSQPQDPNFVLVSVTITQIEAMTPHQKSPEYISL